jgi:hypothetical protein
VLDTPSPPWGGVVWGVGVDEKKHHHI